MSTSPLMIIEGRNLVLLSFSFLILLLGHVNSFNLGINLGDGDKLVSAFGKHTLKFFSPAYTEKRYLGIHYMDDQLVWVANRNAPILDESGWLRVGGDGNLEIAHNGGNPIAISSFEASCCIAVVLLPSGNLVLRKMDSNGTIIQVMWQSFDYPTDTLLPGMKLGMNLQTGHKWFLQSWITDTSPAQGSFTLGMDRNVTNQLIIWWRGKFYQTSKLWLNKQSNSSSSWTRGNYEFNFISNEREIYFSYSLKEQSSNLIKILPDGRLSIPELGFGKKMYVKVPMCRRDVLYFQPKYGFMSGEGFKFKESENMSHADCELKCWYNCSCVAYATTDFDTSCEIWSREAKFTKLKWDDINARYIHILEPKKMKWWQRLIIVAGVPLLILFCFFCYGTWRKCKAKEDRWWLPLTIAVGVALLVPLFCYLCYLILRKLKLKVDSTKNRKKLVQELGENALLLTAYSKGKAQEKDLSIARELKIFDFQTIADATNNFSTTNKLGEGGFGPVYKGQLLDGQEMAIKRLSGKSGQGILEFKNEAKVVAKLQHTNLVRLLGCSLHGEERILVYEYLPNKSLDLYIFDSDRKKLLNWSKRFNIIEGIAQGLLYLHRYSRLRVIHRDLKASNILLDDQMNPKISDFGMARIFKMNESIVNTNRVCGTYGYMSPEYAMNGIVSTKIDVFSFGVLLLEIVSGKKNSSCYHAESPLNLVGYAWQLWKEGIGLELIDPALDECSSCEVLRCLHVGLLCVQDQAKDRPAMLDVVSMITNEAMLLPEPKQPAFYINVTTEEPEVPENEPENCSINDVTISVMVAR